MKLIYLSDLHLELIANNKLDMVISHISSGVDEICVLVGDIGNPYEPNYDKFMTSFKFQKKFSYCWKSINGFIAIWTI